MRPIKASRKSNPRMSEHRNYGCTGESLAMKHKPSSLPGLWSGSTIPAELCNRGRILVLKNSQGRGDGAGALRKTQSGGEEGGGRGTWAVGSKSSLGRGRAVGGSSASRRAAIPRSTPGPGGPPPKDPPPPMPPPLRCLPRERVGCRPVEMQPRDVAPAGATPHPQGRGEAPEREGGTVICRGGKTCWPERGYPLRLGNEPFQVT